MRVVFMGTPALAATVLEKLAEHHEIVGVYTRPDAVRGRGKKLVGSPVKDAAVNLGLEVHTPSSMHDASVQQELRELAPDVICVAAYGAILPPEVLAIPRFGCLNVHTSLLPRWRGAAPMERAILARDEHAGVCIMRMEEGLDTGPYCRRVEMALGDLYLEELESRLAHAGAEELVGAIDALEAGGAAALDWTDQAGDGVVYASKIGKGDLDIASDDAAECACAKVRASSGAHPARIVIAGRGATLERAKVVHDDQAAGFCEALESGQAVFRGKRLLLKTSDGIVEIETIKPDGKKSMDARSFAAGIQGVKTATLNWGRA